MSETAIAAGCEAILPALNAREPSQALVAAKCLGLLAGYDARWRNSPYRIDDVECVLTSDLYNPETSRKSRTFTIGGKIDVRATEISTGAKVVFDHKTTSDDISDPNAPYWRQLVVEGQVTHYMLLEWLNGNKVDAAVWDVIRKPGISPKGISKIDLSTCLSTKKYFGYNLTPEDLDALDLEPRETLMMYSARLAHDCSVERPSWYFQRRQVPRLDEEITDYALDVWDHAQSIITMRANKRYPRISKACMLNHSQCEFLGLCSKTDSLDSGNWTTKIWVHPELQVLGQGNGSEIITNSRLQTLICPQKHYLKYELGVEKIDREEREALFMGNLMHSALEAYFKALQKQQRSAL